MRKIVDITGQKFNKLTAIKLVKTEPRHFWEFLCDCGKTVVSRKSHVVTGQTKTCGCSNIEHCKSLSKHGMHGTKFYQVYTSILRRCCKTSKAPNHRYYRLLNIKCLWESFEDFKRDMYDSFLLHSSTHSNDTSIERIDNEYHYCKENCRWATAKEQANNRHKPNAYKIISF